MLIYRYVVVKVVLISGMEKHIMPSVVQHFLYNIGVRNISDWLSCDDGLFSFIFQSTTPLLIENTPTQVYGIYQDIIDILTASLQCMVVVKPRSFSIKKVVKKAQKIDETKGQRIKHG